MRPARVRRRLCRRAYAHMRPAIVCQRLARLCMRPARVCRRVRTRACDPQGLASGSRGYLSLSSHEAHVFSRGPRGSAPRSCAGQSLKMVRHRPCMQAEQGVHAAFAPVSTSRVEVSTRSRRVRYRLEYCERIHQIVRGHADCASLSCAFCIFAHMVLFNRYEGVLRLRCTESDDMEATRVKPPPPPCRFF